MVISFEELIRGARQLDLGCITALAVEGGIMALPIIMAVAWVWLG